MIHIHRFYLVTLDAKRVGGLLGGGLPKKHDQKLLFYNRNNNFISWIPMLLVRMIQVHMSHGEEGGGEGYMCCVFQILFHFAGRVSVCLDNGSFSLCCPGGGGVVLRWVGYSWVLLNVFTAILLPSGCLLLMRCALIMFYWVGCFWWFLRAALAWLCILYLTFNHLLHTLMER